MMFDNRQKDSIVSFSVENKLDKVIEQYSDENSPSVIEAYNSNHISEDQLLTLVRILEINGYPKKTLYDLPYSFASRLLLNEEQDY
jgi:hypothetical protein